MNRFLLGALAMGVVVVLTSFAVATRSPVGSKPLGGPAWTVSQYQLDRAFRVQLTIGGTPTTLVMPATGGMIITQIRRALGGGHINVTVNGALESFQFPSQNSGPDDVYDLNPPIIVGPGQTISLMAPLGAPDVSISGYTTLPGET